MRYSLDTNTCIRYINGRSQTIRDKLPTIPANEIVVCSIVRGELAYGSAKSNNPAASTTKQQKFLQPYTSLPFDDLAAQVYGRIRAYLEKAGQVIGPYDMQIAAIAIVHDLIVITNNTKEFKRIPELKFENWERS